MHKMDVFVTIFVLLGAVGIHEVSGLLRCIECTHIVWNAEDRNNHVRQAQEDAQINPNSMAWIGFVDQIVNARNFPICASDDPLNRDGLSNPNVAPVNTIGGISEAVCSAPASMSERCNFMYGTVIVNIQQYSKTIVLSMFVRNCDLFSPILEDSCYDRDTGIQGAYNELRNSFQNLVSFFGPGTTVTLFRGRQCICSTNNCVPFTQGSQATAVSVITLLSALVAYFMLKV